MKFVLLLIIIFSFNDANCVFSTAYSTSVGKIQSDEMIVQDPDSIIFKHKLHKHPLPLKIFGIDVGSANDERVIKKFGEGTFEYEDGHCGARYYSVPSKKIQIYVSLGVDRIIEYVAVTSWDYPFEYIEGKQIKRIRLPKKINNSLIGGISLNDSPEKVIARYGIPNKDYYEGELRIVLYQDNSDVWDEVTTYEAFFTFRNNKLIRMSIYNGE